MASKEDRCIDYWLEKFLETGITHQALIALLGEWLASRKSIPALELVANALIQIGDTPALRRFGRDRTTSVLATGTAKRSRTKKQAKSFINARNR